jgi:uncharacterized protein
VKQVCVGSWSSAGAGSLEVAPDKRLLDAPDFPESWKPEGIAQSEALDYYRGVEDLDWTFVSPAGFVHPGERTGRYRLDSDQLLVDDSGNSEVSAEDYAIAIADLLEHGGHERKRITVAW